MPGRGELTDKAWAVIEPLLPAPASRSGRWRDHRQVINGILWKLRTGAPWRDLPERFGNWNTAYKRFARWAELGLWARVLEQVQARSGARGEIDWSASIDSTIVRVHQHGATLARRAGG